ncbi:hypothetical protein WKE96_15320, partial [Edwardsiella tarda]|uniref:hypothetical protein n=1 Tax=Edwardsiella tarda TaxID=636 RepID=UPI0039BDC3D2
RQGKARQGKARQGKARQGVNGHAANKPAACVPLCSVVSLSRQFQQNRVQVMHKGFNVFHHKLHKSVSYISIS